MSAMIGRIESTPGNRDALARALVDEVGPMPGCLSYLVSVEPGDETGVWIAECWVDEAAHAEWLASDATQALIGRLAPLMIGYSERHEVTPIGLSVNE
jgi:quinol monooxygenase YgiN